MQTLTREEWEREQDDAAQLYVGTTANALRAGWLALRPLLEEGVAFQLENWFPELEDIPGCKEMYTELRLRDL